MARWSMSRGSATSDLWWFVAIMIALWILWYATGGPSRPEAWRGPFIEPPAPISTGEIYGADGANRYEALSPDDPDLPSPSSRSSWYGQVRIDTGNARYEIQPGKEYIELTASYNNPAPINITGWQLANSPTRRVRSDIVFIPMMTPPISLSPGSNAILTTGTPPRRESWPFRQSFRINKCIGYLDEEFETLNITPSLPRECPQPEDEPGASTLPDKCYDFVRYLSSCHEPEFKEDREGVDRVDGRIDDLTRQCRLYIQDHFNYNRCIAWHEQDADFYGDEWRVYLGRTWEMWAENRERITLYDQSGKVVAEESY